MFLTPEELREMTGYKRRADQVRWLRSRGWAFELSAIGRPIVLRTHAEQKMGKTPTGPEPDFAALRR